MTALPCPWTDASTFCDEATGLGEQAVDTPIALHAVDPQVAGLADLGLGVGYVGRQVAGWSEGFRRARTDNVPDFEPVIAWLSAFQLPEASSCLIHNDFRLDNLVLDPALLVVGVLDCAEVVQRYRDRTGLAVADWTFYEVFGLFRLAVIAQQIYFRYFVGYLEGRCRALAGGL